MPKKIAFTIILLAIVILGLGILSLFIGVYDFEFGVFITIFYAISSPQKLQQTDLYVLLDVRLPRILLAIIVGSGLAISGTSIQGIFKNPLATPDLIGITSGAIFFAALTIVLSSYFTFLPTFLKLSTLSIMAFLGALFSTQIVYNMATYKGKTHVVILLLSGVAISAIVGASTGLLTFLSTEEELRNLTFWTLGSLAPANWTKVLLTSFVVSLCSIYLTKQGKVLNALQLGELDAQHLGFNIQKTKRNIIVSSSLIVGTCVAFTGTIGFIGLIVPYILRLLFGANYLFVLPLSVFLGSIILLIADTLSRIIVAPSELPIGIITSFMGTPIFIILLIKNKKQLR